MSLLMRNKALPAVFINCISMCNKVGTMLYKWWNKYLVLNIKLCLIVCSGYKVLPPFLGRPIKKPLVSRNLIYLAWSVM